MEKTTTKPATWNDIRQGVRVRCIFKDDCYANEPTEGKIATVMLIRSYPPEIVVAWDDGSNHWTKWGNPGSFEVING